MLATLAHAHRRQAHRPPRWLPFLSATVRVPPSARRGLNMPYARKLAGEQRGSFGLKKRTELIKEEPTTEAPRIVETSSRDEPRKKMDYDNVQFFGLKKRVTSNTTPKSADTKPTDAPNIASSSKVVQLEPPQEDQVIGLAGLGDKMQKPRQATQRSVSSSSRLHPQSHQVTTDTAKLDTLSSHMLHRSAFDTDPSSSRRSSIVTLTPNQYARSSIGTLPPVHTPLKQVQPERPTYPSSIPSRLYNPSSNFSRPNPEVQPWLDEDKTHSPDRATEQLRDPDNLTDLRHRFPLCEPDLPPMHPADTAWAKIDSEWAERNRTAKLRRRRINRMHAAQRDDLILEPSAHTKPHCTDVPEDSYVQAGWPDETLNTSSGGFAPAESSSIPLQAKIRSPGHIILGNIRDGAATRDVRTMFNSLGFSPRSIKFPSGTHDYCFVHFMSEGVARAACDEINEKRPLVLGREIFAKPTIPHPSERPPPLGDLGLRARDEKPSTATTRWPEYLSSRSALDEDDGISATRPAEGGRPTNVLFVANVPIEARRENVQGLLDQRNLRYREISLTIPSGSYRFCRVHITCDSVEDAQAIYNSHLRHAFMFGDQSLGMAFSRQGVVDDITRQREARRFADDVPTRRVFIPSFPSDTDNRNLEDILLSAGLRFRAVVVTKRPREDGTLASSYAHVTFDRIEDAIAMRNWARETEWTMHGKLMKVVYSRENLEWGAGSPIPGEGRERAPLNNYKRDDERRRSDSGSSVRSPESGSYGLSSARHSPWSRERPPHHPTARDDSPGPSQPTRSSPVEHVRNLLHFREEISTSAPSTQNSLSGNVRNTHVQAKSERGDDQLTPDKSKDDLPSDTLLIPNFPWDATKQDLMKALARHRIAYTALNLSRREATDMRPAGHWAKIHFESEIDAIAARDQEVGTPWHIGHTHLHVVFSHEENRKGGVVWKRPNDCTRQLLFLDLHKDVTPADIEAALISAGKKPQRIQMNPRSTGVTGSAWVVYETIFVAKKVIAKIGGVHPQYKTVTVRGRPTRVIHGKSAPKFGLPRFIQPRENIIMAWKTAKEKPTEQQLRRMMKEVLGRDVFKVVRISSKHHYARAVIEDVAVAADFMECAAKMKFKIEDRNVVEFSWAA